MSILYSLKIPLVRSTECCSATVLATLSRVVSTVVCKYSYCNTVSCQSKVCSVKKGSNNGSIGGEQTKERTAINNNGINRESC